MTRLSAQLMAGEHERFAPDAFAHVVGTDTPLKLGDMVIGTATIVDVDVAADGCTAVVTYELSDQAIDQIAKHSPGIGFLTLSTGT